MTKDKDEFEDKLIKLSHIYINAQEAYLYTEYFHNPNTDKELEFVVKSVQLSTMMHLMFRTLINEISKLYSKSSIDKFSLKPIVESLSNKGYYGKLGMPSERINSWLNEFEINKGIIDEVLCLRNKVYAHTDKSFNDIDGIDMTFQKIKTLLDLANNIIKTIYRVIYNSELDSSSPTFERKRFLLLDFMVRGEAQRKEELLSKVKQMIDETHKIQ